MITGLRPGEKLTEVLFSAGENDERPHHPLISHTAVEPLDPAALANEYAYTIKLGTATTEDAHANH